MEGQLQLQLQLVTLGKQAEPLQFLLALPPPKTLLLQQMPYESCKLALKLRRYLV
jgi:hypothetical protein